MRSSTRVWLVGCGIAAQLLTAGCLGGGGGGGLGSLFGFGGGGSGDSFASLSSGGSQGSGGEFGAPGVATVHNPEPASVALFGSGLAGLALLKRRKARRRSS